VAGLVVAVGVYVEICYLVWRCCLVRVGKLGGGRQAEEGDIGVRNVLAWAWSWCLKHMMRVLGHEGIEKVN
jgi:hypothetical protein